MKLLTIIRHAKSSWAQAELDDMIRPLNKRGKQSIKIIGDYLKLRKLKPDLLLTSPSTRTMQTAIGIGKLLHYKIEKIKIEQDIYFGDASSIISIIKNIQDKYNDVFLFGHEPLLSTLIKHFTGEQFEKFPTCAAYRIAFDTTKWNEVSSKIAKCEFYVNPKLLIEK